MTTTKMIVIMMTVMMKGRENEGKGLSILLPSKENGTLPFSVVIIIHQSQSLSTLTTEMNIKPQVRRSLGLGHEPQTGLDTKTD
jgi:hypothetical protein